jgi:plasmid stabilization system protein ParE
MPSFTVRWTRFADAQLIRIWLSAADRAAVTGAANIIDRELADSPVSKGRALVPGFRELEASPLAVVFWVDVAAARVVVIAVRRIDRSRNGPLGAA